MRKILSLILCFIFTFSLGACKKEEKKPIKKKENNSASVSQKEEKFIPKTEEDKKRAEFLETVAYRKYSLTGKDAPYFLGRWFEKDINGEKLMVTTTAGSHLYFLCENTTSINVDFMDMHYADEKSHFAYSIDGATPIRQRLTEKTVNLPDSGYHTVRIIVDNFGDQSDKWLKESGFALKSITANGGSIVGIKPENPTIFFYGDSITEGSAAIKISDNSFENSATNAYSWLTAEKLNVTAYMIGYCGSGVLKAGYFNTFLRAIDNLSKDQKADTSYIPDIIVVNHGENDFDEESSRFKARLKKALDRLRELYPDTPIVYMTTLHQSHTADIMSVVSQIENAKIVSSSGLNVTYTDGTHPDINGARVVADHLSKELINIFGEEYFK